VADADPARLDPAIEEGLIDIGADGVIRFAHPLIRFDGLSGRASRARGERSIRAWPGRWRTWRSRLATRALACLGPSPTVAADLARTARLAHQRGASDTAAELCDRALALSPPDEEVLV